MSNDPKSHDARLAALEEAVGNINAFNQSVTAAFQHILEKFKDLETIPGWANEIDRRMAAIRMIEELSAASRIYPKSRTVIFIGKGYFGDNAKYAYLAFCDIARGKNIACHFLTDNPHQRELLLKAGLPCLPCKVEDWTAADTAAVLGAKVVVLNDNFHALSLNDPRPFAMLRGARSVQLWHGIPVKEVGMGYLYRADHALLSGLVAASGPYDAFVAPGMAGRAEWAQRFAFREFAAVGYPRNDVFFRDIEGLDLLNVDDLSYNMAASAAREKKPVVIYVPTYRDDAGSGWFEKSGVAALAEHAQKNGYLFAVNLHPYEQALIPEFRKKYPSIRFVAPGTDVYPIVKYADVMITDYSSLAFDYLLADRPLVYYRPGHEDYVATSRPFIPGREKLTPGDVTATIPELSKAVEDAIGYARDPGSDPHAKARRDLRKHLFDHTDGKAAKRVCDLIVKQVDAA